MVHGNERNERGAEGAANSQLPVPANHALPGVLYGYRGGVDEKPIREYTGMLLRHWPMLAISLILGVIGAAVVTHKSPKVYQTQAMVTIGSYVPPLEGPMAGLLRNETQRTDYIASQIELLKSHTIAKQVLVNNPELAEYFGWKNPTAKPTTESPSAAAPNENRGTSVDAASTLITNARASAATQVAVPANVIQNYLGAISAVPIVRTSLVRIFASARSPEIATRIANAHADAFVSLVLQQRLLSATVNMEFLQARARDTGKRAQDAEKRLLELAQTAGTSLSDAQDQRSQISERYRTVIEQLGQAVIDRASSEGTLRELRNTSGLRSALYSDPATRSEFLKLQRLKGDYDELKRVNRNHPSLRPLDSEIRALTSALRQNGAQEQRDAEIRFKSSIQKEKILREELDSLKGEEVRQASKRLEFNVLQRETDAAKDISQQVSQRLEDAVVNAQNDQKTVVVIDPAVPPVQPISPNPMVNMTSGVLLGLIVGFALIMWADLNDNSIRSLADLKKAIPLPVLGVIPSFEKENRLAFTMTKKEAAPALPATPKDQAQLQSPSGEQSIPSMPVLGQTATLDASKLPRSAAAMPFDKTAILSAPARMNDKETSITQKHTVVLVAKPMSRESEAFRSVRTTLKYGWSEAPPQLLMVTSGQKGDGKTTLAANLAAALAQTSNRTLLIDADLRLPSVHKMFGMPRTTPGLSDYLIGNEDVSHVIIESGVAGLSLLCAGSPTNSPAELLGTRSMVELLEMLATEFDQIIIDTPPVTHVADALLLARLVDGVALVVRSGKTPLPVAEFALSRLRQVKANILGTVLNDVKRVNTYREPEYYFIAEDYS